MVQKKPRWPKWALLLIVIVFFYVGYRLYHGAA